MVKTAAQKAARKLRRQRRRQAALAQCAPMAMQKPAMPKPPRNKGRRRKNGNGSPVGPGNNRLRLGSGVSNYATTRRSQVIEEDEYIQDINGSVNFATQSFNCNPGQISCFPWGSKVAQLYEQYEFEYLEFYYKRTVSEFATNGQAGKVILSFDYDAADSAPSTKQQVEDSDPHVDGMPCTPVLRLPIDCKNAHSGDAKFIRPGAQPANTDIKTYDIGNLFVSTQGCTNTSVIGELHVRYRVKLIKPILDAGSGGAVAHFSTITATSANNFNGMTLQSGYTPSLGGVTVTGNTITFPANIPGNYLVIALIGANSTSGAISPTAPSTLNIFTQTGVKDATDYLNTANTSSALSCTVCCATAVVPSSGLSFSFNATTLSGSGSGDVFIISLPSTVLTSRYPSAMIDLQKQFLSMQKQLDILSGSMTPGCVIESLDECKEADLDRSIHIPAKSVSALQRILGAK